MTCACYTHSDGHVVTTSCDEHYVDPIAISLQQLREWNAACYEDDPSLKPFQNDYGDLCFFRCPTCSKRFVDPFEGRAHEQTEHGVVP